MVTVSWMFFVPFQIWIGLDKMLSVKPLCPHSDEEFGNAYWYTLHATAGGFVLMLLYMLQRNFTTAHRDASNAAAKMIVINVLVMSTISALLTTLGWGGLCIDKLDYASHAPMWGEWIGCGPLVLFAVLTIEETAEIGRHEWIVVVCFLTCLVAGFCIIFSQPIESAWFLFVFSAAAYTPVMFLPHLIRTRPPALSNKNDSVEESNLLLEASFASERKSRCCAIAVALNTLMPFYTVMRITATLLMHILVTCPILFNTVLSF